MPKVTVYIPDELFERARKLPDGDKTSQIVQRGLSRLLDDNAVDEFPAYATRPDGVEEKIVALREKFLEEAEREYATGYSAAVEVAEALPLWRLNQLARLQFDIAAWLKGYADAAREVGDDGEAVAAERAWLKGYADAAREELFERSKGHEISMDELSKMPTDKVADLLAGVGRLPQPAPEESQWWWVWRLAKVLGFLANPLDFDDGAFDPTNARVRGFADALRDLWDAIESPGGSRIDHAVAFERKRKAAGKKRAATLSPEQWLKARAARESAQTVPEATEKRSLTRSR